MIQLRTIETHHAPVAVLEGGTGDDIVVLHDGERVELDMIPRTVRSGGLAGERPVATEPVTAVAPAAPTIRRA